MNPMAKSDEKNLLPIPFFGQSTGGSGSASVKPVVMAGPCSVESRGQIIEVAEALRGIDGVNVMRAGIWKPRTRPGSFEGIGEKGLPWLREAARIASLPVAVEVATPAHVRAAIESGVDMLWIGARTSVNPFAVQDIADTIASLNPDIPVLVKNPVNPDLELWIGALQRLLQAGVARLGAIHRGFSSYNSAPYRNPPVWQIPMELHRRMPGLPIIHDPSHTGGSRDLIAPLSQQALDLGFNGLMIETHPEPEAALSDGGQQITPSELRTLLSSLVVKSVAPDMLDSRLDLLRRGIDDCDNQLMSILAQRMRLASEIGRYKSDKNIRVIQPDRYQRLLSALVAKGELLGLDARFVGRLLELIHEESVRLQLDIAGVSAK